MSNKPKIEAHELLDDMWPEGVVPNFLPPVQTNDIVVRLQEAKGPVFICSKCNREGAQYEDSSYCTTCGATEKQNSKLAQMTNTNWQEVAKELGLEIFERQPEETSTEWRIWTAYRGYYPGKIPTFSELAAVTGCAVGTITKAAQRWSYKVRLMEWARFTDADIQDERAQAIKAMNRTQIAIAAAMMDKVAQAVVNLEPMTMRPNEITSMAKLATDMQRTITTYVPEKIVQPAMGAISKRSETLTKAEDISEIAAILESVGLLQKPVGIEKTVTTRILVGGEE